MPNGLERSSNYNEWRQKLATSGFTVSIWAMSGIVLAACSVIEGVRGISRHSVGVNASPVEGAHLYFAMNGIDGVDEDDVRLQNARYPDGFITGADGRATGLPDQLHGRKFIAILHGARDSDTGQALVGAISCAGGCGRRLFYRLTDDGFDC